MAETETATTVPPFIPGLLIVSLLIIISILIAWRNYVRRMNPRLIPGMEEWAFWDGDVMEGVSRRLEKPKLWEVSVDGDVGEKLFDEAGWERIMPLSATSLTPEPQAEIPQVLQAPPSTPSHVLPRFRRPKLFSSTVSVPPPNSVPTPPAPLHRLQISVLISMPSLSSRTRSRLRDSSASGPSPNLPDPDLGSKVPQRKAEDSHVEEDNEESAPEVAFGVAVLPWRKTEDEAQTNISVVI